MISLLKNKGWEVRLCLPVLLALSLFLWGCGGKEETEKIERESVSAPTLTLKEAKVISIREFPGEVVAKKRAVLSTKVAGFVNRFYVHEGDKVKKGDPLVAIEDKEIRQKEKSILSSIRAIESQERFARSTFKRYSQLIKEHAVTPQEFEEVRSRYHALKAKREALQAQLGEVRSLLKYTEIRSPVDGTITSKNADEGSFVNAGTPILVVDDNASGYWFVAQVDEGLMGRLHKGEKGIVLLSHQPRPILAEVSVVVPKVDPQTRTFTVKLDISGNNLKSGTFGRLLLPQGNATTLLVPKEAIVKRGALTAIYEVAANNVLHFRLVKLGRAFLNLPEMGWVPISTEVFSDNGTGVRFEVLSGLSPGDRIVSKASQKIHEGMRLE